MAYRPGPAQRSPAQPGVARGHGGKIKNMVMNSSRLRTPGWIPTQAAGHAAALAACPTVAGCEAPWRRHGGAMEARTAGSLPVAALSLGSRDRPETVPRPSRAMSETPRPRGRSRTETIWSGRVSEGW